MNTSIEFKSFPKIARLNREVIVTEKIDGTNACIFIGDNGEFMTGSRNRWITPENDNFGFSKWAHEHKDELMMLGKGYHFGEWWGSGIQRGYGLKNGERRFSLFNVVRWCLYGTKPKAITQNTPVQGEDGNTITTVKIQKELPPCVGLVPVLWQGLFDDLNIKEIMRALKETGSHATDNKFMNPEGIVVFHTAANVFFKRTFENDDVPKSKINS